MRIFDNTYYLDFTCLGGNKEFVQEMLQARVAENGHIIEIIDDKYPDGRTDKYGNSICTRKYYF